MVKAPKIPRKRRGLPPLSPARLAELAALGALPAPPRAGREDAPWTLGWWLVAGAEMWTRNHRKIRGKHGK